MTLDSARIDLRKAFVPGMGYVALSRVKSLDAIYLTGINRMALTMSDEAYIIDTQLRTRAAQDAERFAHLREQAAQRATAPQKKPTGKTSSTSWAAKIATMRQTHPNAYKPWTKVDDETLKQAFVQGVSIRQLSRELGRHEGSIKMRLQKHFGEDAVQ